MTPEPAPRSRLTPRSIRLDLLMLLALCAVALLLWPARHGLTNWQEGIRALVGQQMYERGDWITPAVHGQPYLAKPPMIYWLQLLAAKATGTTPGLLHLRLTVALAAMLGVVLTYFAARRILRDLHPPPDPANGSIVWADHTAFWSAAMLATGILSTRSGRIGELDILLVPFVVGGAWAGFEAWRTHLVANRTNWLAVSVLMVCAAGASLTKGPPGAMVLLFASCFGPVLRAFWPARRLNDPADARRAHPLSEIFRAWSSMHPVGVVLVAAGALWGWGLLVARAIGPDAVRAAAGAEADDNLRLFVLGAPINNLEALSYGVGYGSIGAIAGLIWLLKDRPRLPIGGWMIAAWLVLSLIVFSIAGKGVPRYLTPLWPGVAMLGGMWLASAIRDLRFGRNLRAVSYAVVVVLAVAQGVWYGIGRELRTPERSPRDLIAEVLSLPGVEPEQLVSIDLWHPAVDFYAGTFVEPYLLCGPETSFTIGQSRPIDRLRERVEQGPTIALVREAQPPTQHHLPRPIDLLREAGFAVEDLPVRAGFLVDAMRSRMRAVRLTIADQTGAPDP